MGTAFPDLPALTGSTPFASIYPHMNNHKKKGRHAMTTALLRIPVSADSAAPCDLAGHIGSFLTALAGRNCSPHTIAAYRTDLSQFARWVETNTLAEVAGDLTRGDVEEFLASLARVVSGKTRARKLAALREWFAHLEE